MGKSRRSWCKITTTRIFLLTQQKLRAVSEDNKRRMIYESFDFKHPDYAAVFKQRLDLYNSLKAHPERIPAFKAYYRDHIADFINDWGCTFDPRNTDRNLPGLIPFVVFDRQREWIEWVIDHWRNRRRGMVEKSLTAG
jgi:phage terminase large subunit